MLRVRVGERQRLELVVRRWACEDVDVAELDAFLDRAEPPSSDQGGREEGRTAAAPRRAPSPLR